MFNIYLVDRKNNNKHITHVNIGDKTLSRIVNKYYLTPVWDDVCDTFYIEGRRDTPKTYADKQDVYREFARLWQAAFADRVYSWSDVSNWEGFFETYGARYGLLTEFRENGIC